MDIRSSGFIIPAKLGPPSRAHSGTRGPVYLVSSDGKIVSLPIPSRNCHDPLNWSIRKRALALLSVGFHACMGHALPQGASMALNGLEAEFSGQETKHFGIDALLSAPTLFMGIGAFIWIPMSVWLGRRPVFVGASVLMLSATLLAAFATDYLILLAAICLLGLAQGFSLSAAFLIAIDLTFIHQRPSAIAMLSSIAGFVGVSSLAAVPFITSDGMDWRNFYKYGSFPATLSCVMAILLFPETFFKRPMVAFDGRLIAQTADENLIIYDDTQDDFPGKRLPTNPQLSPAEKISDRFALFRMASGRWKAMVQCYTYVLFCFVNPLIFWVALLNATAFAGMIFIGGTFAKVLHSPPYNLSGNVIVLINVCSGVGSLLAWPLQGPLMSRLLRFLSLKNKGVREAQHYLVMFILPILSGGASVLLFGLAMHQQWHFAFIYLAYGLNGFNFAGLAIANTLWVTEAFPLWAAPAMVVVAGGSCALGFSFNLVVASWIQRHGMLRVSIVLTAIQLSLGLVVMPMAFWDKGTRQYIHGRWLKGWDYALRPQ